MHLFAPERPEIAPGAKAILTDGSAIPRVIVVPHREDTYRLLVMLHKYDKHGGYTYFHADVTTIGISNFFASYMEDPEETLERYFGWTPHHSFAPGGTKPVAAPAAAIAAATQHLEDLL